MVVIMIVIMVMMVIVIMVMVMVMMMMIVVIVVVMQVGSHDTRQTDWVMWMVVAVTAAIVCRGRSREQRDCAETRYPSSSKNEDVIGHVRSFRRAVPQRPSQEVVPMDVAAAGRASTSFVLGSVASVLTMDEARRIASNIAKSAKLLCH